MTRFILGAIVGAVVVWVWGEEIRRFTNANGRSARLVAADTLRSVESVAEEMFDTTKERVTSALQAGQDAIRPA